MQGCSTHFFHATSIILTIFFILPFSSLFFGPCIRSNPNTRRELIHVHLFFYVRFLCAGAFNFAYRMAECGIGWHFRIGFCNGQCGGTLSQEILNTS